MNPVSILTLALLAAAPVVASAQDPSPIRLEEVNGRTWLVDPHGRPFFAHGVTHVGNNHGEDVKVVGKACKELGFNAYGYGCPNALKTDLPYLEGRQLVPMSLYRVSDASFGYVDIFAPKVRTGLENEIKKVCLANRGNPNLIGYCWTDLGAWPLENATGKNWVDFIRGLPADAPGRKAYREFLKTWQGDDSKARDLAFLRVIGAFWCNPINSKPGFQKAGIKQGLFDRGLTPRPDLNQAIRALNQFLDDATPKKER